MFMRKIKLFLFVGLLFCGSIQITSKSWVNWDEIGSSVSSAYHSVVDYVSEIITTTQTVIIQGSGVSVTRTVKCADIHSISVHGQGVLHMKQIDQGDENVVITADDNVLPYIQASVKGKTLEIKFKNNLIINTIIPITYHVSVKNIEKFAIAGSVSIQAPKISTDTLTVKSSGSSNIDGVIKVDKLDITGSGSTEITLSGSAEIQNITLSGSGSFDGQNLVGKKAAINLSGATTIVCNVSQKISGHISGASKIQYVENPSIDVKTSGASTIKRK